MSNKIKYPFAKSKTSSKYVHISEVQNGVKCNCYCEFCNEDLIAVNNEKNIVTDHFKHKPDSNCQANLESFLHSFTKEIFTSIDYIKLPSILDLGDYKEQQKTIDLLISVYNKHGLPKEFINFEKTLFQKEIVLKFNTCQLEKIYKSDFGNVRIDIVLLIENEELFIEPFYSNRIDYEKLEKLELIDKSTISINLNLFTNTYGYLFKREDFIKFIQEDIASKNWIYIRKSKIDKLRKKYIENLDTFLLNNFELVSNFKKISKEFNGKKENLVKLNSEISKLKYQIKTLQKDMDTIQKKLKFDFD